MLEADRNILMMVEPAKGCRHCENFKEDPRSSYGPVEFPFFFMMAAIFSAFILLDVFSNGWDAYFQSRIAPWSYLFVGSVAVLVVLGVGFLVRWYLYGFVGRRERHGIDTQGVYHRHDGSEEIEGVWIEFVLDVATVLQRNVIAKGPPREYWYISRYEFGGNVTIAYSKDKMWGKAEEEVSLPIIDALCMVAYGKKPSELLLRQLREE